MNAFSDNPTAPTGDPLERLIEAFVDQSVPEGPDPAIQRRLIAEMRLGGRMRLAAPAAPSSLESDRAGANTRRRRWVTIVATQAVGLAAAVLIVVGAAFLARNGRPPEVAQASPSGRHDHVAVAPPDAVVHDLSDSQFTAKLNRALETIIRTHGRTPDPKAVREMLDVLREDPRLADSEPWRLAQQRLSDALDQPAVIGVGVGLLGAIPWTATGRF